MLLYHINERDRNNSRNDSLVVDLTLNRLPFKKYRVDWYTIDETYSNAFAIWIAMGKPKRLSDDQHRGLSHRGP